MPTAGQGIIDLLSKLDEDSVFALSRTVTQGLKRCNTIKDAWGLTHKTSQSSILSSNSDSNAVALNERSEKPESNVNVMAEQFSRWFYSMLNGDECGIEHFFPDASFSLNMYTNNHCDSTRIEGDATKIANSLLKLKSQNNLHFNPNDSQDGIQGRIDPHGLVMVLTCGTVHSQNTCAGVFEQVFALARDPFCDNNWKIKTTSLNLRSKSDVLELPKLCDSDLTSDLLMLPLE
uniref:NTF2 domain-containing protein n=1 Tax=Dendroctonus ponderosae TaxID=77166 RepID=A0AAR5QKJ2_DENPD